MTLQFQSAGANFLLDQDHLSYAELAWDPRWRPYNCPQRFPLLTACHLDGVNKVITTACLQNTICAYRKSAIPGISRITWNRASRTPDYQPRALYYRADQNFEQIDGKPRAPRYHLSTVSGRAFTLDSITFAWPSREGFASQQHKVRRAKSIIIRGYVSEVPDAPVFSTILTVPQPEATAPPGPPPESYVAASTVLPQTPVVASLGPVQTMYPPPTLYGIIPGVSDPEIFYRHEFPHNKVKISHDGTVDGPAPYKYSGYDWDKLLKLEISAYGNIIDEDESPVDIKAPGQDNVVLRTALAPGEFFLREINMTLIGSVSRICTLEE
ncbi:hypothetical protein DRE_02830 [Drechslerella stenobrocha 248]|uniref:Uncharacterized protein n=1 Tax=Drechslerella stenobrocha 248 TaxID=1043628 RepID=W7I6R2_9PEZI|nr:hypothetical protein DRE_02830 [Drechslerella stenobrocha 248]